MPASGKNLELLNRFHRKHGDYRFTAFVTRHARMVSLVTAMLDLHKQLAAAKTADEMTAIKRIIEATDREIDRVVYELYGLTEEEIGIVEEGIK